MVGKKHFSSSVVADRLNQSNRRRSYRSSETVPRIVRILGTLDVNLFSHCSTPFAFFMVYAFFRITLS